MLGEFPAMRLQVADVGLKVPVEFVANVTVPVGTEGFVEMSNTFAVQFVAALTKTDPGEQLTTVLVESIGGGATDETARLKLPVLVE